MANLLVNPSFQQPVVANGSVTIIANPGIPGWTSQGAAGTEMWGSGAVLPDDPNGGTQKVEVDSVSTPWQIVNVPAEAGTIQWAFDARQRAGTSAGVRLRIGDAANPLNTNAVMVVGVAPTTSWQTFSGTWPKPAGVTQVRMEFTGGPGVTGSNAGLDAVFLDFIPASVLCECCPIGQVRCYTEVDNSVHRAFAMLCDGDIVWIDENGNEIEAEGPELLANGDFEASTGIGAASSIGPGWQTDYVPCGPNIFAAPCSAGRYAFFTTNAGQATGNAVNAVPIQVIGTRSMAVNVSSVLTADILRWVNIPLTNGRTYRFSCMAAVIGFPFGVSLFVDGVAISALTPPPVVSVWTPTTVDFLWTGTTGNHTVSIRSNNTTFGGNDHAFDGFSLRSTGHTSCS